MFSFFIDFCQVFDCRCWRDGSVIKCTDHSSTQISFDSQHPFTFLSIYPPTCLSIHSSIYPPIHWEPALLWGQCQSPPCPNLSHAITLNDEELAWKEELEATGFIQRNQINYSSVHEVSMGECGQGGWGLSLQEQGELRG